jgi:NTE family protein
VALIARKVKPLHRCDCEIAAAFDTPATRLCAISSAQTLMLGQPGFFEPHRINPWLAAPGTPEAISFYDTAPLRETLNRLVAFDYLNDNRLRLSLGAVNVETGEQVYFDSAYTAITVEHVMASGALPPSFPPVRVGADLCWDGGVLSNTPLFTVLDEQPRVDTLCFMVDLWDPVGPAPGP